MLKYVYLHVKNCSYKNCLFIKLTLNTTLLNDKKVICEKINCLIHTISSIIICFLLSVVICASCYFYYTKYLSKQKHFMYISRQ